ncbi:hypothetical protein DL98DRAFT_459456 [Cadophora sp. DSE1049]|nr:hypothetical protein DL98DRAFT_459456 [Cadophora sp. DSE1049]
MRSRETALASSVKGKPRGFRRDRDCRTCKSRGVKCDLNRPECTPCLQQRTPCGGYPHRVKWASPYKQAGETSTPPYSAQPPLGPPQASPSFTQISNGSLSAVSPPTYNPCNTLDDRPVTAAPSSSSWSPSSSSSSSQVQEDDSNWTTHYVKYFTHFRQKVEQSRSRGRMSYPASAQVLTGDIYSDDPLSSVWTFAWKTMAHHLTPDDILDNVGYSLCHTAAVQTLSQAISQSGIEAIFGIVTFAFVDVYKGPFGAWPRHLRGARALLDLHCSDGAELGILCDDTSGLQEAISILCWYDATGLIVTKDRDLIFEDWHRQFMDDSIFGLVGCPKDTFMSLVKVARAIRSPISLDPSLSCNVAEQLLQISASPQDHALLLQDAWRYTVVMIIFEALVRPSTEVLRAVMHKLTQKICDILHTIPGESAKYRHLPLAVYMAGRYAQTREQSLAVQAYWRTCNSFKDPIYPDGESISQPIAPKRWHGGLKDVLNLTNNELSPSLSIS